MKHKNISINQPKLFCNDCKDFSGEQYFNRKTLSTQIKCIKCKGEWI